jgi:hypothetical protein
MGRACRKLNEEEEKKEKEKKKKAYRILVGKPEGKRPLGRRKSRWEDNIKMYPGDVGSGSG